MSAASSSSDTPVCAECGTEEEEISSSKKECTSCEQKNDTNAPCELLNDMSINGDKSADIISTCANCGKKGVDVTNTCNKCKMVKYCNAACKKKHRHKHKKDCEKHVGARDSISNTEVNGIVEGIDIIFISEDMLFQDPPAKEDCPICLLPMPHADGVCGGETIYQPCCGKTICDGCVMAVNEEMKEGKIKSLCPFCRVPLHFSKKEFIERFKKRMKLNDANAFNTLGDFYDYGEWNLPQDPYKAFELHNKAAELGSIKAHASVAIAYIKGEGVEKNMVKALHHWKLSAIGGHELSRYNLGCLDSQAGNVDEAMKHFIIAAKSGYNKSLQKVGEGYKSGYVSKDDYANTLRAFQHSRNEMKSEERSKAAAKHDWFWGKDR